MQKHIIAFDFDDVLIDFNAGFLAFHNRVHATSVTYENIVSYDMELIYGCAPETILERVKEFYQSADHADMKPIHGSVEATRYLRDHHLLDIVTSRSEALKEDTGTLVKRFFPDTFRTLHFTNGFGAVGNVPKRSKSEICQEIGAVILIEDALKYAEEVARKDIPVLLPDRPWNRDYTPKGVVRVKSWDEIISWIETHL